MDKSKLLLDSDDSRSGESSPSVYKDRRDIVEHVALVFHLVLCSSVAEEMGLKQACTSDMPAK